MATEKIKKRVDGLINVASNGKFKTLQQVQAAQAMYSLNTNEFLNDLKNLLSKVIIWDTLSKKLPFIEYFWDETNPYGDAELIRQNLLARHSEYTEHNDLNDHWKINQIEQIMKVNFRDRIDYALSANIVKGAFLGYGEFNNFITQYKSRGVETLRYVYLNRFMRMFESVPIVYELDINDIDTDEGAQRISEEIYQVMLKFSQPSTIFNETKLPLDTPFENQLAIFRNKIFTKIQFRTVGGTFNFRDIKNGGNLKDVTPWDFENPDLLGCLYDTRYTFRITRRINESGTDGFARNLVEDNFQHEWTRWARIAMANKLIFVKKGSEMAKGKLKNSLFTMQDWEGNITKDEPNIINVTNEIEKSFGIVVPTDLRPFVKFKANISGNNDTPTKDEIIKGLNIANIKFDGTTPIENNTMISDIINITNKTCVLVTKAPYVINSNTNELEIKFNYTKGKQDLDSLITVKELGELENNQNATIIAGVKSKNSNAPSDISVKGTASETKATIISNSATGEVTVTYKIKA